MGVIIPGNINVGENVTISVTLPTNTTGEVHVKVGDKTYNTTVKDGIATIITDKLDKGNYEVTASYYRDNNYTTKNMTGGGGNY